MIPLEPDREIYPNAPLKLVTFELRFHPVDLQPAATERFVEALGDSYPIAGPPPVQQLMIGPIGHTTSSAGARIYDNARRRAVTLAPEAMTFETSAYKRFEHVRDSIAEVLEVISVLDLEIVPARVGLRYIDEIDEAGLPAPGAWQRYIDPALSCALDHFDTRPVEHQSAALFEGSEGEQVVLRYGLMRLPAVDPAGPLVIESPPRGRYYLIDIDSAWTGSEEATPLAEWTLEKLTALHAPVRRLFESSITEELRNDVLRRRKP